MRSSLSLFCRWSEWGLERLLLSIRKQALCLTIGILLLVLVHFLGWNIKEDEIAIFSIPDKVGFKNDLSVNIEKMSYHLRKVWSLLLYSSNLLSSLIFIYPHEKQLLQPMMHLTQFFFFSCNCACWMLIIFKENDWNKAFFVPAA